MTCEPLQQLFQLCQTSQLRLSGSDLYRIVCKQCDKEEVCPSVLVEQFESHHADPPGERVAPRTATTP